jgi:hypothetical protein
MMAASNAIPMYQNLHFDFLDHHPNVTYTVGFSSLSSFSCHCVTIVPAETPIFCPCTVTEAVLSLRSNLLGPEPRDRSKLR